MGNLPFGKKPGEAHAPGESVFVEYKLTSKNEKGGLVLTLSSVTDASKGTATFLTRRIFNK